MIYDISLVAQVVFGLRRFYVKNSHDNPQVFQASDLQFVGFRSIHHSFLAHPYLYRTIQATLSNFEVQNQSIRFPIMVDFLYLHNRFPGETHVFRL